MRVAPAMVLLVLAATACRQDMHDQPKYEPLEPSAFFKDGRSSRPLVDGTVARGRLETATPYYTGKDGDAWVRQAPVPATAAVLARGRERYDVFCSVCHDRIGNGDGMIVRRGFKQPPSFHEERLRAEADGHFFDAITHGFGVMPNYAEQIPVADRWAITLYIRALQLSQAATTADVPAAKRATLDAEPR